MGEHRDRNDDSHIMGSLECKPDGNAVEQAVQTQHGGGNAAARRRVAVKQQNPVQNQVAQESQGGPR